MTTIPQSARVASLECKLSELTARDVPAEWYRTASRVLRGGDGGEHGLLLYKLIMEGARNDGSLVALDVGTARGFSAITMARAMLDGELEGRVYSVDVIGHHESRKWHVGKQEVDEPLGNLAPVVSE